MNRESIRIRSVICFGAGLALLGVSCTTLPEPKLERHKFPARNAFVEPVKFAYTALGSVRARRDFSTLDPVHDEGDICKNAYNGAVQELVKTAHAKGGDAVINVKSIVFYEGGKSEVYKTAECSDEGDSGQVLVQGVAVKYKPTQ